MKPGVWFQSARRYVDFIDLLVGTLALAITCVVVGFICADTLLAESGWYCVKKESQTHMQPMQSGNTTIWMPVTVSVCVQYDHKAVAK